MSDLQKMNEEINQFCLERDWDQYHNLKDLAIGASTEAAELLEVFRFLSLEDIKSKMDSKEFRESIADELVDVLFFVLRIAEKGQFDLPSEFQRKMAKNRKKYPVSEFRGSNKKSTHQ